MSDLTCYRDRFTASQRRRAEALILVRILYPAAVPSLALRLARWVAEGGDSAE